VTRRLGRRRKKLLDDLKDMRGYCELKEESLEVTRRQGRRRKKLLDDLQDRRGYCELKEEALDRTMWRNRFARGFGPVV
jgi:transcription elongation GreA/GreB family factor